ncbi:MAG: hypothetical protein M3Z66_08030 [Chloroflexota bacterium]|nr:hypothetical protein [Chloroflexota bacterium]
MKRLVVAMAVALVLPLQTLGVVPALAAPALTLTSSNVKPGTFVGINGTGFTAGQTVTLTENVPGSPTQQVVVNTDGTFTSGFTVPTNTTPGPYQVTANGAGATNYTVNFQVTNPAITVSPTSAAPGGTVTVTGSGLTPSTTYLLRLTYTTNANVTQNFDQSVTTGSTGSFSAPLTVPTNAANGTYTIHLYTGNSTSPGTDLVDVTLTVSATTAITVSPQTVTAGTTTTITVSGTGFGPSETVTSSYTAALTGGGTQQETVSVTTNAAGAFTATLNVPTNLVPGSYTISAAGNPSGKTAQTSFTASPTPAITLNPTTAPPGTLVVVTGNLFTPNLAVAVSAQIPINSGSTQTVTGSSVANGSGTFTAQLFVPSNAKPGTATVTATQAQSGGTSISATATLTIQSLNGSITASPSPVNAGGIVTITGSSFGAGPGSPVTVSGSVPLTTGGTSPLNVVADTSSNGSFTAQLLIPTNAANGNVTVTATQTSSGITTTTAFVVVAQTTATPTSTPTSTPTVTPTPSPTPTASPTPTSTPIVTPTPTPSRGGLHFRRLSLWYHVVRLGTFDHVDLQSNMKTRLGIWAHVIFPSGVQFDYYENTDSRGHWIKTFDVPLNSISRYSNRAFILFQLWHGRTSVKDYLPFTVIR